MNVPLLDLKAQYASIKSEIDAAIAEVLESQHFILGPKVEQCEKAIAAYSTCAHAIGVSSGSDALIACLMAEGIGAGEEVITTPYTFFATAGAIARLGAKPVFVDIDPDTYNINPAQIAAKVTNKTRAIIPVHLYGQMADMDAIMQVANQHQLVVIEDAAQAIGAEYQGRRAGSIGHYGCFSFFPSKNLGCAGDGGMIVTQDAQRAEKLRILRGHGSKPKYYHKIVGGNFRLDAIQAAIVSAKLPHLDSWTAARQRNARKYDQLFGESGLPIGLPSVVTNRHIFNQYVIRVSHRNQLQAFLQKKGIGTEVYYPVPMHLQECFAYLEHKAGSFPESERAAKETVALPVYPEITEQQIRYVVECVREFVAANPLGQGTRAGQTQSWLALSRLHSVDPVIGVIPKSAQVAVVEEFFQLFKTPWEFYQPGRAYDVVIATADDIPPADTRLLVVYGSATKSTDQRNGISVRSRHTGGVLECSETALPIYGELSTFEKASNGCPCVTAAQGTTGLRVVSPTGTAVVRLGYDLFHEVEYLLSSGQPIEHASCPTLDIHIAMLRNWILNEGIPLLEIPAAPAGHSFSVCLTHDIDFVGIRNHKFDHTMWGFLYRSSVGALQSLFRRRVSFTRFLEIWRAAASLPFVFLGWAKDFWEPFEWYLQVEKNLPATYFLIPFKRRAGEHVPGRYASRRATAYDVGDIADWTAALQKAGCELGVHGIDAWHSAEKGRDELARIAATTGASHTGIRMHWLLRDADTPSVLESAGYAYDSTFGYNETVGYRAGTSQVFRPLGAKTLLELPLHIQDGALFYPQRLDLSEPKAEKRCQVLIDNANKFGGVLTLLWHDRSHGPERFWGGFYAGLVQTLRSMDGWFGTAAQVVGWFRKRRDVRFERWQTSTGARIRFRYEGGEILPPLKIRVYRPSPRRHDGESAASGFIDIPWNGKSVKELELRIASQFSATLPGVTLSLS